MPDRILRNAEDVDKFIELICGLKLPVTVSWKPGADRSGQQNKTVWMWAGEAAEQLGDRGSEDIQAEWKLTIGVPILRADDPEFRAAYDRVIRPLKYEDKIRAMKLGFPVTSLMKVRQMVRFMDEVQRTCAEVGIELTDPADELANYNKRYRKVEETA